MKRKGESREAGERVRVGVTETRKEVQWAATERVIVTELVTESVSVRVTALELVMETVMELVTETVME